MSQESDLVHFRVEQEPQHWHEFLRNYFPKRNWKIKNKKCWPDWESLQKFANPEKEVPPPPSLKTLKFTPNKNSPFPHFDTTHNILTLESEHLNPHIGGNNKTMQIMGTSPECHSGVSLVPMVFQALLMERCATRCHFFGLKVLVTASGHKLT